MTVRVLIVDDHPSFRATARLLLETEGFEVVGEEADGASGLRAARELSPDLVLLDVQLPDIDGFEVAAQLTAAAIAPRSSSPRAATRRFRAARGGQRRPGLRAEGRALRLGAAGHAGASVTAILDPA